MLRRSKVAGPYLLSRATGESVLIGQNSLCARGALAVCMDIIKLQKSEKVESCGFHAGAGGFENRLCSNARLQKIVSVGNFVLDNFSELMHIEFVKLLTAFLAVARPYIEDLSSQVLCEVKCMRRAQTRMGMNSTISLNQQDYQLLCLKINACSVRMLQGLVRAKKSNLAQLDSARSLAINILAINGLCADAYNLFMLGTNSKARDAHGLLYCLADKYGEYALFLRLRKGGRIDPEEFASILKIAEAYRLCNSARHKLLRMAHIACFTESCFPLLRMQALETTVALFHTRIFNGNVQLTKGLAQHAICVICRAQLRRFPLNRKFRAKVLADIRAMCALKRNSIELLQCIFKVETTAVDVLIDGANVGYAGLHRELDCSDSGQDIVDTLLEKPLSHEPAPVPHHLWFEQIGAVVRAVQRKGLRPLIILHKRHIMKSRLWDKYIAMVKSWLEQEILIPTPNGVNDDLFWLYALLFHSGPSQRIFIVTNDSMRDHKHSFGEAEPINRLYGECRVKFRLLPPGTCALLQFPPPYSEYPQFASDSCRWHIPARHNDGIAWRCCKLM